jgi:hypothetical protein
MPRRPHRPCLRKNQAQTNVPSFFWIISNQVSPLRFNLFKSYIELKLEMESTRDYIGYDLVQRTLYIVEPHRWILSFWPPKPSRRPSPLPLLYKPTRCSPTQCLAREGHAAATRPCPDAGGQSDRAPDVAESWAKPASIARRFPVVAVFRGHHGWVLRVAAHVCADRPKESPPEPPCSHRRWVEPWRRRPRLASLLHRSSINQWPRLDRRIPLRFNKI